MDVVLTVIPAPPEDTDRTVFVQGPESPKHAFVTGMGDVDCLCGSCSFVLLHDLETASQVSNLVFLCPECGAYNDTRT